MEIDLTNVVEYGKLPVGEYIVKVKEFIPETKGVAYSFIVIDGLEADMGKEFVEQFFILSDSEIANNINKQRLKALHLVLELPLKCNVQTDMVAGKILLLRVSSKLDKNGKERINADFSALPPELLESYKKKIANDFTTQNWAKEPAKEVAQAEVIEPATPSWFNKQ